MESVFEIIKNPLPFDKAVFDELKDLAEQALENAEQNQYTQAVVLLTANGNKYSILLENALSNEINFAKLSDANDTEISGILCMWQDGNVDVPSMHFRKKLCDLDPLNENAEIFVRTRDGFSAVKLKNTLK